MIPDLSIPTLAVIGAVILTIAAVAVWCWRIAHRIIHWGRL